MVARADAEAPFECLGVMRSSTVYRRSSERNRNARAGILAILARIRPVTMVCVGMEAPAISKVEAVAQPPLQMIRRREEMRHPY